ncbi:MAG: transporter substrate-binding domain-containing protein [Prevotella ruminicola]|uniref:histidine kinase n=1 Tax=Xylanibacter ruminicola TaxID=839 RepID=A0A928BTE2_XYLRU|nr:transporter substrate-binding domain-containing protein [Xylanibacter ruminicola]
MIMKRYKIIALLVACHLSLGITLAQQNKDSIVVYNDKRPLIYEDAWDLWPYVFLNENGEPDGYNIDLLKMIFKELDIPYEIRLRPTLEAQKDLKDHKSDLMLRMDADFARHNSSYGRTIVQIFTHSLVKPKGQAVNAKNGKELSRYPVIVHDKSFSHYKLMENGWAKEIIPYDDMKEAIQNVSTENNGIILWNSMSLKWLMTKYHTDNLEIIPFDFPYGEYKFFANDRHLLNQLDSVYSILRANDRLTAIQNKWFYPERQETGIPSWIWDMVKFFTILAVGILVYYTFFKIRERKMTQKINKENQRLSLIMKTSNVMFCTYNVSSQYFTVMDSSGHAERSYSLLEYSHRFDPNDFTNLTDGLRNVIEGKSETVTIQLKEYENNLIDSNNYTVTLSVLRRDKHKRPSIIIILKTDTTQDRMRQALIKESMLRYQSLFNSALVDMVYYDADGYISDMNTKALSVIGVDNEEIRRRKISLRDVLGMKDLDIDKFEYFYATQLYKSPNDNRTLNKVLGKDQLYYELQVMPIYDKFGNRIGFFGTGRNVTESANSYRKLKENSKELQIVKDDVSTYVHNIDYVLSVGGISLVNYRLDTHTLTVYSEIGHEKYSLTQTRALAFVDSSSEKQALRVLNKMDNRQTGSIIVDVKTCIRRRKDRLPLHLQLNFVPTIVDGEITEYFGLIRDISEIKAVEEKLAEESVRAQEVETVKNAFLHNMSHEIRTPLNTVVGFSELFQMEHSPEDEALFINEIKNNSASLLKLINDILFLSRLDAGMITLSPQPIDFASIFAGRCSSVWDNHKQPGVEYIVQSPYNRLVVEIDEPNVSMIINKIITNAIQHTKSGSVLARYEYIADRLLVSVEDTGSGIKKENLENIFGRFVTGANNGAGLGLSICHELVQYMGGNIELTSTEGKGTTVWFSIPCKMVEMERK